jgi:hypothetical protein
MSKESLDNGKVFYLLDCGIRKITYNQVYEECIESIH